MEVKIVLLGGGGVGKSSITIQLINNHFVDEYDPTIEDNYRKQIKVDGESMLLDILDTAGQDEYSALRDSYIRTGNVFILIYSITDRGSFEDIQFFYESVLRIKDNDSCGFILVGNKTDLENHRTVTFQEGQDLANILKALFFESSARSRMNITEIFEYAARIGPQYAVDSHIQRLERSKQRLRLWQFLERKRIKKALKDAHYSKDSLTLVKKSNRLKEELETLFLPSSPLIQIRDSSFIQDFSNLINHKPTCDQIVRVQSIPFHVHKIILKARCPELSDLIGTNFETTLPDVSYSAFNLLMEYIYTGILPKEAKLQFAFTELMQLSKKFRLTLLSKLCLKPANEKLQKKSKDQFEKDIHALFNTPSDRDCIFKVISFDQERTFHLHRSILLARSAWFRSCFCNQWKESNEKYIVLNEVDGEAFDALIEFLYTDSLSAKYSPDTLIQLLKLSDQMNLLRLKEICEANIADYLELETVLYLYQFCVLHGATQLEKKCLYFISLPENFSLLQQQREFHLIEYSIQKQIQIENQKIADLQERRNSLLKSIQECDFALNQIKKSLKF